MKKKILHVLPISLGGTHTILQEIVKGTLDLYEISILILGECSDFDMQIQKNVHIYKINTSKYSLLNFLKLSKFIKNADIVHVHLFPALYYCAFFSRIYKHKKFIYTEHASMNNRRKHNIFRYIEIPIYKSYDNVVAVSKSCEHNLCTWLKYKVNNISVINNGIDSTKYKNHSTFNFADININSKYIIVMVARLSSDKDFNTLIDAISFLNNDYHLVLLGEGELRSQIEERIREKNLCNKVSLLGYRTDVYDILAASTLSVLSSYAEGFSLVILESILLHVPCIGSNVDGIKDILPASYMFECGNSQILADLIVKIVNKDIEPLPYEKILNSFSAKSMVSEYVKLYNKL